MTAMAETDPADTMKSGATAVAPLNLVVMLGGPSAEREVSLKSGAAVADALESIGHTVTRLDPKNSDWRLPENSDGVFLALHGRYGEDGTIQAKLDGLGVIYTGCGAEASALAFNKARTKEVWTAAGVPTPRGAVLTEREAWLPEDWRLPVIMKPVCQGSSVGLQIVESENVFESALEQALEFDNAVLMEELIRGREFTVGILDGEALPLVEIRPRHGTFDYQNKYTEGATDYFCPADLDQATTDRIQSLALRAFDALGGQDYGRLDVMLDAEGNPFFLELNTLPGMTETSLLPKAAEVWGMPYPELCHRMVELALTRAQQDAR